MATPILITGAAGRVGGVGRTITELLLKQGKAAETIRRTGELQLPLTSGKSSPIASQDVARVIAEILVTPGDHLGRIYELTGPRAQDLDAIAEEYSKGLGRTVKYRALSWEEWADPT